MIRETEPGNRIGRPDDGMPSFDEFPPREYQQVVDRQLELISEETGFPIEEIHRLREIADQEKQS